MRVENVAGSICVGPGRGCSPCCRMSLNSIKEVQNGCRWRGGQYLPGAMVSRNSRDEGSKSASMTWRAISARPCLDG